MRSLLSIFKNASFSSQSIRRVDVSPLSNAMLQFFSTSVSSNTTPPNLKTLTDLRRGSGGRSSFNGLVVTVFGANCNLGRAVINQLGKVGTQVIAPYRGDPYDSKDLKLMGDLGQVLFMPYHIDNDSQIRQAIQHSSVVINLIGKWNETKNFSYHHVHVDAAQRLARISREMGIERFIHVSCMGADPQASARLYKKGAEFLRTKGLGEQAVRAEFPRALIVRPSYMWGQMDNFLFYFTGRFRSVGAGDVLVVPLWQRGTSVVKQPVHVHDVGRAIAAAAGAGGPGGEQEMHSTVLQAVGPHAYRMNDLITWMFMHMRYEARGILIPPLELSYPLFIRNRWNMFIQPINPPLTYGRFEYECHSDVVDSSLPILNDVGVTPVQLEDRIAWELRPFRRFGYYWDALGEFPEPPNPPLANVEN